MVLISPTRQGFYDPGGDTSERSAYYAFYRTDITFDAPGRPWVLNLEGGAWAPDSGLPFDTFDTDGRPILAKLYYRGFGILSIGRTVTDVALDGNGAFDPTTWTTPPTGGVRLDSTPANLGKRSSEKDVVNFIQFLRFNGIGDLDRSDAANGIWGRSMGSQDGSFVGIGPDRRTGSGSDRFNTNTRLGWMINQSTIATWKGYVDAQNTGGHLTDGAGGNANTVGEAKAAPGGAETIRQASSLWYAFANEGTRLRNATMPVWIQSGAEALQYAGPYDFDSYDGVVSNTHPPENVEALREAFLALDTEFGSTFQAENSRFVRDYKGTDEALGEEQYQWVLQVSGVGELPTREEATIQALVSQLEGITTDGGFRTEVAEVRRVSELATEIRTPGIAVIEVGSSYQDGAENNANRITMQVVLELTVGKYADLEKSVSNFVGDVRKAIYADRTLGGKALDVRFGSSDRWLNSERGPRGGANLTLSIEIFDSADDPYLEPYC